MRSMLTGLLLEDAVKADDGEEHWVTINGNHILIGADGEPKAGQPAAYGASSSSSGRGAVVDALNAKIGSKLDKLSAIETRREEIDARISSMMDSPKFDWNSKDYKALSAESDKLAKEEKQLTEAVKPVVLEAMRASDPAELKAQIAGKAKPDAVKNIDEALKYVSQFVSKSALPGGKPVVIEVVGKAVRASYQPARNVVQVRQGASVGSIVHEVGHWLDYNVPGMNKAMKGEAAKLYGKKMPATLNYMTTRTPIGSETTSTMLEASRFQPDAAVRRAPEAFTTMLGFMHGKK